MGVEDVNDAAKHQRQIQALRGSKSQSKKKQELPDGPSQEKQGDNVTISPAAKEKIKIARYAEIVNKMHHAAEEKDLRELLGFDLQFHDYILELADHSLLRKTWHSLELHIQRFLYLQPAIYDNLDTIAQTHEPIVSALEAGDSTKAREAIEQHISEVAKLSFSEDKGLAGKEGSS